NNAWIGCELARHLPTCGLWVHDCEDGPCASMDDLVESALQEIALEGRDGCSAGRIWSLLNSRLPISNIQQLSDGVKQLVWVGLLHRWPADILLYTPATQPGPSSVVPPGKKGGKPRKKPEPVETVKDYKDPSAAPTYQQAEAQQLFITTSDAVRRDVFGLYDAQYSRFQISDVQIRALEAVGRARSVGVLQAQLASQMDITNSNFFYVVKQMEARGLVVRTPVMVNYSRGQSHMVTTNVLHLKQYAPPVRLGPYQVFKVVDTDGSHAALDADTAVYTIQDDMRLVRLVTERIAATEDKVVLEGELKVVLGFTGKRGHRTWRRLKVRAADQGRCLHPIPHPSIPLKMVKDGYIGVHVADMNGKAVVRLQPLQCEICTPAPMVLDMSVVTNLGGVCLKLLKEVKATPLEGEEEEEEQGVAADPGKFRTLLGHQELAPNLVASSCRLSASACASLPPSMLLQN
ncbi:hypothetical protein QJQ45_018658, partial [Haematococcus lacustris]